MLTAVVVTVVSTASLSWLCGQRVAIITAVAAVSVAIGWKYKQLRGEVVAGVSARLVWRHPSSPGLSERRRYLAGKIARIVESCRSLQRPEYLPPVFASGVWSNLALYVMKQLVDKNVPSRHPYWRQRFTCPDGGVVSIDYLDDDLSRSLPQDAPVVIFLHTITGSVKETSHFMRVAARRGWRSCVFNRRGHGGEPLRTGAFNVMGDVNDTQLQTEAVREMYPDSFIGMCGISAGSGLLFMYLGKVGENTPVQAACSLCPAYDITEAFKVHLKYYWVDKHILNSIKRLFLQKNEKILSQANSEALLACSKAGSIHEFINAHSPFAGFDSSEQYYAENNPMEHVMEVRRPILIVNSDDDVVSLSENIKEDVVKKTGGALLLRTKRGSHLAFNEGFFGTGCFLSRISMDFLETAKMIEDQKK